MQHENLENYNRLVGRPGRLKEIENVCHKALESNTHACLIELEYCIQFCEYYANYTPQMNGELGYLKPWTLLCM